MFELCNNKHIYIGQNTKTKQLNPFSPRNAEETYYYANNVHNDLKAPKGTV